MKIGGMFSFFLSPSFPPSLPSLSPSFLPSSLPFLSDPAPATFQVVVDQVKIHFILVDRLAFQGPEEEEELSHSKYL